MPRQDGEEGYEEGSMLKDILVAKHTSGSINKSEGTQV